MKTDDDVSVLNGRAERGNVTTACDTVSRSIDAYVVGIELANATNLARKGEYSRAEVIVSQVLHDHGESPMSLDLLARIYAQQGRLAEAETLWKKALILDPSSNSFQEGIRYINKMQRRPLWLLPLANLLMGLILITAVTMGGSILIAKTKENTTPILPLSPQLKVVEEKLRNLEKSIQSLKSVSALDFPPNLHISLPGLITRVQGNELIVTFDEGLFAKGTIFKPDAKSLLTDLGRQLEPFAGSTQIEIYGITNNVPMPDGQQYSDNTELGKARAASVFEHFRNTTNLMPDRILMGSSGEFLPPFSNNTIEGRAQNRTVLIRISYSG